MGSRLPIKPFTFIWKCILFLPFLTMFSGCSHYTVNHRVDKVETEIFKPTAEEKSDELFIVLAFSGGGTRAAALSYGVLETLDEVMIPGLDDGTDVKPHSLLDEVDLISSVSGGSITAAYYGLHGKQTFNDFKDLFLYRNVNRDLFLRVFSPVNAFKLGSTYYGRSDLAAEYYDSLLFHGATFGDLEGRGNPDVFIQATDIVDGIYFGFSPAYFGLICSDWESYPISRAVAASAAFPGPFSAITLRNYGGTCGLERPPWMIEALEERDTSSRLFHVARHIETFLNSEEKPYVHLVDGGVADNLGLRGPLEVIMGRGGLQETLRKIGREKIRRVVFIIVNAEKQIQTTWGLSPTGPGLFGILGITSSVMISSYNYETIELLRQSIEQWSEENVRDRGGQPIEFHAIEVAFSRLRDERDRKHFSSIPTSFNLPDEEVDSLIDVAGRLLYESEEFQELVSELGGNVPLPK